MKLNLRKNRVEIKHVMNIDFIIFPLEQYKLAEKGPNIMFWNISDELDLIRELCANRS